MVCLVRSKLHFNKNQAWPKATWDGGASCFCQAHDTGPSDMGDTGKKDVKEEVQEIGSVREATSLGATTSEGMQASKTSRKALAKSDLRASAEKNTIGDRSPS